MVSSTLGDRKGAGSAYVCGEHRRNRAAQWRQHEAPDEVSQASVQQGDHAEAAGVRTSRPPVERGQQL